MRARFRDWLIVSVAVLSISSCGAPGQGIPEGSGVLAVEARSDGQVVPARVEIVGADGTPIVPDDALPTWGDCDERRAPMTHDDWDALVVDRYRDYFTDQVHYYSAGRSEAVVPPGSYHVRLRKGPEYRVAERDATVVAGAVTEVAVDLDRWVHMARDGWYSGDVHLHIPRLDGSRDGILAQWMRAEDLNVANVLQFGNARGFLSSPQFAFGPQGVSRTDATLILPGQENPRISILGHLLMLGGAEPIDLRQDYFDLPAFADAGRDAGAVQGFAHKGAFGGEAGMAILLPRGTMDIFEVLTRTAAYGAWYEALNMGARIAPVAGTDFPCGTGQIMPGAQRVYVRSGTLSAEAWLAALRQGRSFVTNGPMLDLVVDGAGIGEEIVLPEPRRLQVELSVRSDPEEQRVERVTLVVGGRAEHSWTPDRTGEFRARWPLDVVSPTWIAVHVDGVRPRTPRQIPLVAHTAPVWVQIEGRPPRRTRLAPWLERLAALERSLEESRWQELPSMSMDGFSPDDLRDARGGILQSIAQARRALTRLPRQ